MTTVTSPNLVWGPAAGQRVVPAKAESTYALDDNNDAVSTRFYMPRTGTISKVGVYVTAITGTPPAYNVGLMTVDKSGNPTTTPYGGGAITSYSFGTTGWIWVTLGTAAVGTAGDLVSASIWPNLTAGTPSAGACITVRDPAVVTNTETPGNPRCAATWYRQAGLTLGAMYSDDSIGLPAITAQYLDYDSGGTPDEAGALFQLPFAAVSSGAVICTRAELSVSDYTIKLYDASNTLLSSTAIDVSQHGGDSSNTLLLTWGTAVSLTADTNYRLTVVPSTTNDVDLTVVYCNESASRAWFTEGTRWQMTQRTDAGAWTETATALPMMGLVLSSFDLPTAGTTAGTVTGWAGGMIIG